MEKLLRGTKDGGEMDCRNLKKLPPTPSPSIDKAMGLNTHKSIGPMDLNLWTFWPLIIVNDVLNFKKRFENSHKAREKPHRFFQKILYFRAITSVL